MGDDFRYLDIIIFAIVAGFLVLRLRSVLGRRTGQERQRPLFGGRKDDPAARPGLPGAPRSDVVQPIRPGMPSPRASATVPPPPTAAIQLNASMPASVGRLRAADPSFDADAFLGGAKAAFEMIVAAFAAGDTKTLQPLLSADVYHDFTQAITGRERDKETLESRILSFSRVEIDEAELRGRTALVTVRFQSQQTNVIRDAAGQILEGDPARPVDKVDLWTFSREIGSSSPDWRLVTTASP